MPFRSKTTSTSTSLKGFTYCFDELIVHSAILSDAAAGALAAVAHCVANNRIRPATSNVAARARD
jgi:hypothetical protein